MNIGERIRSWHGPVGNLGKVALAIHLAAATGCGFTLPFLERGEESARVERDRKSAGDSAEAVKGEYARAVKAEEGGESFVLRSGGLEQEKAAAASVFPEEVTSHLTKARELFRQQEYSRAEDLFGEVADREKNPPLAIQEALFYRAECLRLQGYTPKAADTYVSLLNKFPTTGYREQSIQHVFDIANRWLDDTRAEMREAKEKQEGKRWVVWPRYLSFEKSKPFLDREGRAIEKLEQVRMHDINGPLADRALFLCGVVKMYNEDYRGADLYFSQIYQRHKDSPLAAKAIELGIQCKHLSTGGSDYDGRKSAEARSMVRTAMTAYPELANNKEMRTYLEGQMGSIDMQQAEKEFKMAEFYRRTGHPGSAFFYYELVRRRYPNTKYAKMSEEHWAALREKLEREQGVPATNPAAPRPSPAAQSAQIQPVSGTGQK